MPQDTYIARENTGNIHIHTHTHTHTHTHLCGNDNWLSTLVALGNHHLLCHKHLLWRYLNSKVTPSNHHTISRLQDLIKIVYSFVALNLHTVQNTYSTEYIRTYNITQYMKKRRRGRVGIKDGGEGEWELRKEERESGS